MNKILSILTGSQVDDPQIVIDQGFNPYNTGCSIKTTNVYSICKGMVLSAERDPYVNTWCITVEVNSQQWIRYCLLDSCKVEAGQELSESTFIGISHKNIMRLEYCTIQSSDYPVRILGKQLYKRDPTPVIFSQIDLSERFR